MQWVSYSSQQARKRRRHCLHRKFTLMNTDSFKTQMVDWH